jgi:hypothetical protein
MIDPMPTEELFGLIGAWAKAEHPEKYVQTLEQVSKPATFRAYLVRLVELRVAADPAWIREVPVSVLDESGLTRTFRCKATPDERLIVGGRRSTGRIHVLWSHLALDKVDFDLLTAAVSRFDLDLVPA